MRIYKFWNWEGNQKISYLKSSEPPAAPSNKKFSSQYLFDYSKSSSLTAVSFSLFIIAFNLASSVALYPSIEFNSLAAATPANSGLSFRTLLLTVCPSGLDSSMYSMISTPSIALFKILFNLVAILNIPNCAS